MLRLFRIEVTLRAVGDAPAIDVVFEGSTRKEALGKYDFAMDDRYCEFYELSYVEKKRDHEDQMWSLVA